MATKSGRTIAFEKKRSAKEVLLRWETLLIFILLAVNVMNVSISPNYLNLYNLFTNISSFLVKGFIASVIGGLGSITGAVAGAFLLGIVEVALIGLVGSGWTPACVFVVMLVFLLLRPRGISGVIVQEKA